MNYKVLSLEEFKQLTAEEPQWNNLNNCLHNARAALCGIKSFEVSKISPEVFDDLKLQIQRLTKNSTGNWPFSDVLLTQDILCLHTLMNEGQQMIAEAELDDELALLIDKTRTISLSENDRSLCDNFFDLFPIPADYRLVSLEYPWGKVEEDLHFEMQPRSPVDYRQWEKSKAGMENLPLLLADETPGEGLQKWFEKRGETFSFESSGKMNVHLRLDNDWRVVVDVNSVSGAAPEIKRVSLGEISADPQLENDNRWTINLAIMPQSLRERVLEGDFLVESHVGEIVCLSNKPQ